MAYFKNCVLVSHVIHDKLLHSAFFSTDVRVGQKLLHCEKCSIFNLEELLINCESGKHVSL